MAPRWMIVGFLGFLLTATGALFAMVVSDKTDRQKRVEEALKDVPSKYQSQVAERVTVTEIKIAVLEAQMLRFTEAMERQTEATIKLTAEVQQLNKAILIRGVRQ